MFNFVIVKARRSLSINISTGALQTPLMVGVLRSFRAHRLTAWVGAASDAIRDQVMQHDPMTGVFSGAHINHRVKFNTQDDGLTLAFAHMRIRCSPSIPKKVPEVVLQNTPSRP